MANDMHTPILTRSRKRRRGDDNDLVHQPLHYPFIRYAIDMGTSRLKYAYTIVENERQHVEPHKIEAVKMGPHNMETTAPMGLAYDENDKLIWGFEAERRLKHGPNTRYLSTRRLDMIKLAIWSPEELKEAEEHQTDEDYLDLGAQLWDEAQAQLRSLGKDKWDIVEDCLRAYTQCMLDQVRKQGRGLMNIELFLLVPQLWDYATTRRYVEAGKRVVSRFVRPVAEALSAAAFISAEPAVFPRLQNGLYTVVCDSGGGTTDCTTCRFEDVPWGEAESSIWSSAVKARLRVIGMPRTKWCGSAFINHNVFVKTRDQVLRWYHRLELHQRTETVDELFARLRQVIEEFKRHRVPEDLDEGEEDEILEIGRMIPPNLPYKCRYTIVMKRGTVRACFDKVLRRNLSCIEEQLKYVPRSAHTVISIPGGLGSCLYFLRLVEARFQSPNVQVMGRTQNQDSACVRGACLRFDRSTINVLPPDLQFGIAWDEPFSKKLHRDAVDNPDLIHDSFAGGRSGRERKMVTDRAIWIWKQGQSVKPGHIHGAPMAMWQEHYIPLDNPTALHVPIYCADRYMEDHEAVTTSGRDSALRPGVFKWDEITIAVEDLNLDLMEAKDLTMCEDGSPGWMIAVQSVMKVLGADVLFGCRVGIEEELVDAQAGDDKVIWAECKKKRVCEPRCNPFVFGNEI